jgi:hypothetical protein
VYSKRYELSLTIRKSTEISLYKSPTLSECRQFLIRVDRVCLSRLSSLDSRLSTLDFHHHIQWTCHRYKHAEARASERSCCSLVEIARCHARARSGQAPPCHTRNTNQTKPKTEKRPYRGETIAASKCNLRRQVCLPSSRGSRNRLTAISSFK